MIHEDERRTLEDWLEAKIITAKKDCVLGRHFHKIKTEKFILERGICTAIIDGHNDLMQHGELITVLPGQVHTFVLNAGSVLIGLCSHPYDPTDDYK